MISGTSDPVGSNEGENTSEYRGRSSLSDTDACEMSESSESNAQPRGRWGKTFVPRVGEKPHRCLSCGRCFSTSSGLALHRCAQASEGPHTCQTCSKTFISSSHLATHLRTHAGEKRHKCTLCNKVFAQPAHLVRHRAVHTGEKSFRCPDCSRSFGRASHLKTHHRLHTGEKPFRCPHCEKAFTQKAGLIMHLRQHTGERPFKCGKCGKGFRTSAHLLSHQALESGEGRHTCARCLKGFRSVMALRQHERSHGRRAVESEPRGWGLGGGATVPHCSVCCSALVSASHLQPGCPVGDVQCVYHCKVCSRMFSRMSAFERHCEKHLRELSRARDTGETDDDLDPLFLPHMTASPQYTSEVNTRSKTRAKRQMEASD